ncbi:hypothetical protein T11_6469 [Trichinella zimbabwensis]|uniref:Uncharacterized protein n=1 Tax=Trichinella zimbabwensis TaxID=268475 RepID=A0A0V1GA23_9BILA|nr:hypothetical protein T11_6469 [Trichinella zimbabwensis]
MLRERKLTQTVRKSGAALGLKNGRGVGGGKTALVQANGRDVLGEKTARV